MEQTDYNRLGEKKYQLTLPNGMQVLLVPKTELSKTYAIFMTNYGAINRMFTPLGEEEIVEVPDGIAHFLEHKLFEKEDRDVFSDFLSQGASPNAFTSFTKTAYLFSTVENAYQNVNTLLDFVQEPYFSDESVEKEKGIISQEIHMYDDQADWQAFIGTIKNMFAHHPVRIDILGTDDTIDRITKEDLYTCYETFYHPSNMTLCIAGNFNEEEMAEVIKNNQAAKTFKASETIVRQFPEETKQVAMEEKTITLPVSTPKVTIGIKESSEVIGREEFLERDTLQHMLLDYFFSQGGPFYEELYEAGMIDDSFEFSTTVEESFGFSIISTNTQDTKACGSKMIDLLLQTRNKKLTDEDVRLMKKRYIGDVLTAMNAPESIAVQLAHYHFMDIDFFSILDYAESLTTEKVNQFLQQWIKEEALTMHRIEKE
ncbi:MAG TPA: pitrilysin family protein [Pseudogracilibacillus sp.]|nr:pitrilysin family protein [Pseudogracilibacillus sp.]